MKQTQQQSRATELDSQLGALKAAITSRNWQQVCDQHDRVLRSFSKLQDAIPAPGALATLAFQPEAFDSAAAFVNLLTPHRRPRAEVGALLAPVANGDRGYTVTVVPVDGDAFDAEVVDIECDDSDGQYKIVLAEWDEDAGCGDRRRLRRLDIYDDLERIEVI
jgi:hypothetical protein